MEVIDVKEQDNVSGTLVQLVAAKQEELKKEP